MAAAPTAKTLTKMPMTMAISMISSLLLTASTMVNPKLIDLGPHSYGIRAGPYTDGTDTSRATLHETWWSIQNPQRMRTRTSSYLRYPLSCQLRKTRAQNSPSGGILSA